MAKSLHVLVAVVDEQPGDAGFDRRGIEATRGRRLPGPEAVRFDVRDRDKASLASISATEARRRLYSLIDEVGESHEPVQINGKRGNAVLLSEADWNAIQETLHLVSIPGMRESILEGLVTPPEDLSDQPGW